jgi:tRNA A37 N6-isopentenylltransferase MiaA
VSLEEAVQQIKHHTHRFVRHQSAWFRLSDPQIEWFDLTQWTFEAIVESIG